MSAGTPTSRNRMENTEFTVKAEEDLVLRGKEREIVRVARNNMYSCLMLKNQRFSSLFRHYGRHHGLLKESLEFFFTNRIGPDDTPDSICLQNNDIITVRQIRAPPVVKFSSQTDTRMRDKQYFNEMKQLLTNEENTDVTLEIGPNKTKIRAHKLILTTHCEYFSAMFRSGASMRENTDGVVAVKDHSAHMVKAMLEFIYSNNVANIKKFSAEELIELLELSEHFLLPTLRRLCEQVATEALNFDNAAQFLAAGDKFNAKRLRSEAMKFILDHGQQIFTRESFTAQIQSYPELAVSILKESVVQNGSPSKKKRRRLSCEAATDSSFALDLWHNSDSDSSNDIMD